MIFVTLGSQKFQFNRLLQEIDWLIEQKVINDEVFAQIGYSDYRPQNFKYKEFLDREEFAYIMNQCNTVITHGGTGAIIGALKQEKKVIAIPRLKKYGEHVDDHQLQITQQFLDLNLIETINDISELKKSIEFISEKKFKKYISNTHNVIKSIDNYLETI